jgi:hypothetical protein
MAFQKKDRAAAWKTFIEAYERLGLVDRAIEEADISRRTIFRWMADNSKFREEFVSAREAMVCAVEDTLFQKAIGGDVTAAIFMLKSWRPERYHRSPTPPPASADESRQITIEVIEPSGARQALIDRLNQQARRMEAAKGLDAEAG